MSCREAAWSMRHSARPSGGQALHALASECYPASSKSLPYWAAGA